MSFFTIFKKKMYFQYFFRSILLLLRNLSSVLLNGFVDRGVFDPVMAKEILQKTTQIKFAK